MTQKRVYVPEPNFNASKDLVQLEPTDVPHARAIRRELIKSVEAIDVQLRNRTEANGRRSDRESQVWRGAAVTAQSLQRQRLGYLAEWIKAQNREKFEDADTKQLSVRQREIVAIEKIADALPRIATALEGRVAE